MAVWIKGGKAIDQGLSLIETRMPCYDTLDDPSFEFDRDFLLHNRSALEFGRERMNAAQLAELDKVDAHWRTHAEAFNRDCGVLHHLPKAKRDRELEGFVLDEDGNVPPIPRDHWWWWPIEEADNG